MVNQVQTFSTVAISSSDSIDITQGSVITFKSVSYHINTQKRCEMCSLPCLKKTRKTILSDLSGVFKPGMNAIMGPSGSGKSSLLDVLADRKDRQGFKGEILLNGQMQGNDFKYRVGYVVQDDIVCGSLTVRENLLFSANVRLPTKMTSQGKSTIVDDVIAQLGLEKCANATVGTDFKRGISGGERKRTNIGMELVLSPDVLFLDEPTTGLDSSTAYNVMEYLHQLSRKGRTIIFSIHQPRYSIFKLFDVLYLVAAGRCVYHGPSSNILEFFSSVGYQCEEHNNPADFILDVSQGDRAILGSNPTQTYDEEHPIEAYLNESYLKTSIYQSIAKQLAEHTRQTSARKSIEKPVRSKSRLHDLFYLSQRTLKNSFRDPSLAILQTANALFLAILVGLIYLNTDRTLDTGVKNRNGAIFFIVTNQVFSNLSALDLFIKERILFIHENVSGYYHVLTYFFSKILCDILPLRTIPAIGFSIVVYFMIALQRTAEKFFIFFFCVWITSVCASSLCFFVSATVKNTGVANLFAALFCVLTLVFSGFLVEISSVVVFLQWIQYFSIFRYATNILTINEYKGLTLCAANDTNYCSSTGDDILTQLKIQHATQWDLWKNFLALGCLSIGFLTLTYIQLRRLKKTKQNRGRFQWFFLDPVETTYRF